MPQYSNPGWHAWRVRLAVPSRQQSCVHGTDASSLFRDPCFIVMAPFAALQSQVTRAFDQFRAKTPVPRPLSAHGPSGHQLSLRLEGTPAADTTWKDYGSVPTGCVAGAALGHRPSLLSVTDTVTGDSATFGINCQA